MLRASYLDEILGEDSLRLYTKVFLLSLFLDFAFERLLPRFADGMLLMLGRVGINFGILMEFLVLVSLAYIFRRKLMSRFLKIVSTLIILVVILAIFMYYIALSGFVSTPELSILFESSSLLVICLVILRRMFVERPERGLQRFFLLLFLTLLLLAFAFFYYYDISVMLLSHYLVRMPLYLTFLDAAETLVLTSSFTVFIYAQSIPWKNLQFDRRTFLKIFIIPTLVLLPLVAMMLIKPLITQYMAMLLVEILGFTFPRSFILVYLIGLWFYFTGILTLMEKRNISGRHFHKQESIALLIVFFAGFLSGVVYYYFIGLIGILLLTTDLKPT